MKFYSKLSALGAVLVLSTAFASADQIGSYANDGSPSLGNNNSALSFSPTTPAGITPYAGGAFGGFTTQSGLGGTGTITLNNVTPTWAAAQPNSTWVSFGQSGPNTPQSGQPNGNYPPNGNYFFTSTFSFGAAAGAYTGSLSLLADDTVTVFLNGVQENTPTDPGTYPHCSAGAPNCKVPTLVTLNSADFNANGLNNVLTFQVTQGGGADLGLDFTGSVSAVPEPSSLMLLGTGLLGSAGALMRRMRA